MTMQIINVEQVPPNAGTAIARFDVRMKIFNEDFDFPGFSWNQKGEGFWVGASSRKIEKNGETKYIQFGGFVDPSVQRRFLAQVRVEFKKYLETNPNMEPEPVVGVMDEECPF